MMTIKFTNMLKILFVLLVVMVLARAALSETFIVTTTADSGVGSLREAIEQANSTPGSDDITFGIFGTGTHTIQPASPLPELTEEVVIDGYTQPGSQPATDTSNAVLNIVLDGSSSSGHLGLLSIDPTANGSEIRGLVISNYDRNGIFIEEGANGNVIEGNYIGTDYTGTAGQPNLNCGIFIRSSNNRIGGTTPDARNVISNNVEGGITIYGPAASGNQVLGNFIGTDASGMSYLPNSGVGVGINDAPDNVVGGTTSGSRNVVTSIDISNPGATNNQIVGNYIGINATGDDLLSGRYTDGCGVLIKDAFNNVVGPGNVISGCIRGVIIWPGASYTSVHDNYIGTDATGQLLIGNEWDGVTVNASHNRIEGNVVSGSSSNGVYVAQAFLSGILSEMPSQNIIADNIIGMTIDGDPAPNTNGIVINTAVSTTVSGNMIAWNIGTGVGVANDLPWAEEELAVGNRITQNAIYDNGGLGIELVPDGVTPNDPGDTDTGPNNFMNFPKLTSAMATLGQLVVMGTIDTPNLMSVTLEFFANSDPDDTGYGEGEVYLGTAKPNATGSFVAALPAVSPEMWISATATDGDGNTSEFSESILATAPGKP